ncbi:hypothetical protein ACJMK2_032911 [Sinanodonta woodiana]|uniref:carbonyl reductase (NADPH) n=1 Tax=Sinanodonta woodiana TaxID=1069815 RepID=A0ABD3X542_SINWO
MAMPKRVAVVTGSNKGIGFAIVRGLCKQFDGDVYLTARDESRGMKAVEDLKKEGLNPLFHQLDISDPISIHNLKDFLHTQYGGLDVLINNAAIADMTEVLSFYGITQKGDISYAEQAENTMKINVWDTLAVCDALFPLLRPHARVVNVSSEASTMIYPKCSEAIKSRIRDPDITMDQFKKLFKEFEAAVKSDTVEENGWAKVAYGISKIAVRVMSYIQGKDFAKDSMRPDIVVNSCCPGDVDTDMTDHRGVKTIDEGAETPLYLALLPPNVMEPKGEFVKDKQVEQWPI